MYVLEQQIERENYPEEVRDRYLGFIKEYLSAKYVDFIGKEIQTAYLESYSEYGQNIFDRYVTYADFWIQDQEYRDPETGDILDRGSLNEELEKIEKPAGISNPKDFRNEIVNFVLRARANNNGRQPVLAELREAALGHREEDVLEHRRSAAGDFVHTLRRRATTRRSTTTSSRAWSTAATRRSRCACCPSGTCACASRSSRINAHHGQAALMSYCSRSPGTPSTRTW